MALSSSPGVTACLLNLLHALETVLGDSKPSDNGTIDMPSWRSWTACANFVGFRYHLMLPGVTSTLAKCKTCGKTIRKVGKKISVASTYNTSTVLGSSHCSPSSEPVVNFINHKAAETD